MRASHFYPLMGFAIPSLIVGYGFVIPNSCIAGINTNSVGFGLTILGACTTYWVGLRRVVHPRQCEVKKNAQA